MMKNCVKFIAAALTLFVMFSQPAFAKQLFYLRDIPIGGTVYFGTANSMMQSNAWYAMTDAESQYCEERQNGQLSLFSREALKEKMKYDTDSSDWANSTLHNYLNGTYYDTAFSTAEKSIIATRGNEKSAVSVTSGSEATQSGLYGGYSGFLDSINFDNFWSRTKDSEDPNYAYTVYKSFDGHTNITTNKKNSAEDVRPILLLNANQALFFTSAVGGKSAVKPGDGFTLADANVANGVKATVVDESITAPTGISVTQEFADDGVEAAAKKTTAGETLDLTQGVKSTYQNPLISFDSKGGGEYLSVYAKNDNSANNNYAKVSAQESGKDVVLSLDGLKADGAYSLYFYSETEGGNYYTDYASKLSDAYTVHKGNGTAHWGTLSSAYKDSAFGIKLGSGFKLSLDNADYNSTVNVVSDSEIDGNGASVAALNLAEGVSLNLGSELIANGDSGLDSTVKTAMILGSGKLTIGKNATFTGTIDARKLGAVKVLEGADVIGSLTTTTLEIGSVIDGEEDIDADITAKYISFDENGKLTSSGKFTAGAVTALGTRNTINSALTTAIGSDNFVLARGATAIGYANNVSGIASTAVGFGNNVSGDNSGAFGDPNVVSGNSSYAVGNNNTVAGNNTFVMGSNVTTNASNSVVLGANSTAERDNAISVGAKGAERQIINVAEGEISADSTDAVNGSQLYAEQQTRINADTTLQANIDAEQQARITDITAINASAPMTSGITAAKVDKYETYVTANGLNANGKKVTNVVAGEISATSTDAVTGGQLYETNRQVAATQQLALENQTELREVGAISAALAGLRFAEPTGETGDKFSAAAAYGGYRGASAAAVGLAYKPSANLMLSASTSVGNSQNAYNAGVSLKFGKGNSIKTRAALQKRMDDMAAENKNLKSEIEALKNNNAKLEQRLEKLEQLLQTTGKF